MRIRILSDLHNEFGAYELPDVPCDCIIFAGDVDCKAEGLRWIRERYRDVPVLYVLGNHEYYDEKWPRLPEKLRAKAEGTNIEILEDREFTIGGIHFFGCTLWTDMALFGDWHLGAMEASAQMNDYKKIRNSSFHFARITPKDTRLIHLRSLEKLRTFLTTHDPRNSVVITHHAPSQQSLPDAAREELLSCAYTSNLDSLIHEYSPRVWIHGHIHQSQDYYIGNTRILSNPRGYPHRSNPHFSPSMVLSMDPQ